MRVNFWKQGYVVFIGENDKSFILGLLVYRIQSQTALGDHTNRFLFSL